MNLTISMVSAAVQFSGGTHYKCVGFSVHPEGVDKADGLHYGDIATAKAAAIAWVRSAEKEVKAADKEVQKAVRQAENATKAVQRRAEKAAEREAERAKILAEKKAKLDAMNAAGTFSLVG